MTQIFEFDRLGNGGATNVERNWFSFTACTVNYYAQVKIGADVMRQTVLKNHTNAMFQIMNWLVIITVKQWYLIYSEMNNGFYYCPSVITSFQPGLCMTEIDERSVHLI